MHRFIAKAFTLIGLVLLNACSQGQSNDELSPEAFAEMIRQNPSLPIVDVRTPEEYQKGHLSEAINIDWNNPDFEHQIKTLDTLQAVFLYCLSGGRSASAASLLRKKGFKKVYELKGGITQWRNAGYKEIKGNNTSVGMSKEIFLSLLKNDKPVLVNFYASWCTPCKKMEPDLVALEKEMKGKMVLLRIDADDNQTLFKELKLEVIPTLLLYKQQQLIWSQEGYVSKQEISTHLK